MSFGAGCPAPLVLLSNNLFLMSIVVLLLATLIRHRGKDSYRRDNIFFLIILPLFWIAKKLLLQPDHFHLGWSMTLGLFRVAFLVMLERTLSQFMRSAFSVEILRRPALDTTIKVLAALLVFAALFPAPLPAGLELLLAVLLLGRLAFWHPLKGFSRLDIGIMFLGYLAIVAQLLIDALPPPGKLGWVGTVSVHAFTFGAMGLVIPAMMIRIANGHTGRKVMPLYPFRQRKAAQSLLKLRPQRAPAEAKKPEQKKPELDWFFLRRGKAHVAQSERAPRRYERPDRTVRPAAVEGGGETGRKEFSKPDKKPFPAERYAPRGQKFDKKKSEDGDKFGKKKHSDKKREDTAANHNPRVYTAEASQSDNPFAVLQGLKLK